jgi:hypothetical protein
MIKSAFGVLLLATAVSVYPETFYVSERGDDRNAGLSTSDAWRTLAFANARVHAGDLVLIGAGNYREQIRPARSGRSDNQRITYKALGDGLVTLTAVGNISKGNAEDVGAIALGGRNYVTVDGVNQFIRVVPGSNSYIALGNFNNAHFNVINSVHFDGSTQAANGGCVFLFNYLYGGETESSYNVLRNSYLEGRIGSSKTYTEDTVQISGNAHHNLVDGNTILNARHVALNVGSFTDSVPHHNVIRNNIIDNPEHTALQLYNKGPHSNLIEGNYISASGGKPVAVTTTNPGNAIEYSGSDSIFRYNLITKGGATDNGSEAFGGFVLSVGGEGATRATNNRVYNNTIVKNSGTPLGILDFGTAKGAVMGQGVYINNLIYAADSSAGGRVLVRYWDNNQSTNDRYIRNGFGNPLVDDLEEIISTKAGSLTVAAAVKTLRGPQNPDFRSWNGFENVYDSKPGFADLIHGDFKLLPSSKFIDSGAPLTQVSNHDSAEGSLVFIDDPRFFQDGMGIPGVMPDWIAVGSIDNSSEIFNVDNVKKVLTLRKAIIRKRGDFVWLFARSNGERVIKGNAPDVGAFEAILSALPKGPKTRNRARTTK